LEHEYYHARGEHFHPISHFTIVRFVAYIISGTGLVKFVLHIFMLLIRNITSEVLYVLCFPASGCDVVLNSDTTKNGSVSSPLFPNPYPARSHCRYDFQGRGKERVQIVFSDFNLYHPTDNSKE
jgi:hypothetical protein